MDSRGKLYQPKSKRLIFVDRAPSPEYWDAKWEDLEHRDGTPRSKVKSRASFVSRITNRFVMTSHGPILEGGCGRGQYVAELHASGYQVVGVDYAKETVQKVKMRHPDLDIREGDVRQLKFPDCHFMGYWSLGVIEHFWCGYDEILREAKRVLAPGGILFLAFPHMSRIRRLKVRMGRYPVSEESAEPPGFFQFALDAERVTHDLQEIGFTVLARVYRSATDGLEEEAGCLGSLLYRVRMACFAIKGGRRIWGKGSSLMTRSLGWFCGHSVLLVAKSKTE